MVRIAGTRQVRAGWMVEFTILGCAGPGLILRETLSRLIFVERRLCIYRVVRDPQLGIIGSDRRCSSVKETRFSVHHRSLMTELWINGIVEEMP